MLASEGVAEPSAGHEVGLDPLGRVEVALEREEHRAQRRGMVRRHGDRIDRAVFAEEEGQDVLHRLLAHDLGGETAWPGMAMTMTGDGWLGIPPTDRASSTAVIQLVSRRMSQRA